MLAFSLYTSCSIVEIWGRGRGIRDQYHNRREIHDTNLKQSIFPVSVCLANKEQGERGKEGIRTEIDGYRVVYANETICARMHAAWHYSSSLLSPASHRRSCLGLVMRGRQPHMSVCPLLSYSIQLSLLFICG